MKNRASLPEALERKLSAFARQVHRIRLTRGISLFVLAAAAIFGGVFILELWLEPTAEIFSLLLAGTVLVLGLLASFGLLLPLGRRLNYTALAARIEQEHPELAERLLSSVELSHGNVHGSEELITQLLQQTEAQTHPLSFGRVLPSRKSKALAAVALLSLLLAAAPAVLMPERFADFSERFLLSWFAGPAMRFEVSPGDGYAARGRPLSWKVTVHRRDERIAIPRTAYLVLTDKAGRTKQILMQAKKAGSFTCSTDRVTGDVSYYIDAAGAHSRRYRIKAVAPVQLAGAPQVTVSPPPYVNAKYVPDRALADPTRISSLQYGCVQFTFDFSRSAIAAYVKATPTETSSQKQAKQEVFANIPVHLSKDRKSGVARLPLAIVGSFQMSIRMEAEQQILTEQDLPELVVRADQVPYFTELPSFFGSVIKEGKATKTPLLPGVKGQALSESSLNYGQAQTVAPDDAVRIKIGVADDEGIDQIGIEIRVNNEPLPPQTIMQAEGALKANVEHQLSLQGKVKDGDLLEFRIKAVDNRRLKPGQVLSQSDDNLPSAEIQPHVIYYPPVENDKAQWLVLKVDSTAKRLYQQEIAAQHEAVQNQIAAIKKKIEQEQTDVKQLERFGKYHDELTPGQKQQLIKLRQDNEDIKKDLMDFSRKTFSIPDLQALSFQSYKIAEEEMTRSGQSLANAQEQVAAAPRGQQLSEAHRELSQALKKLEALQKLNEELAKDRLDLQKLQQLADKEMDLSEKVAQLEAKKAADDPKLQKELERLKDQQQQVAEQIQQLAQQNPAIAAMLQKAQAEQAKLLAQQANRLAQEQKQLVQAMDKVLFEKQKSILDEFAKKQKALAEEAGKLGQKTAKAAQVRLIDPLNTTPTHAAANSLKRAAVTQALQQQAQSAREMERLAQGLDNVLQVAGDTREVLETLLERQKKLVDRLEKEAAQVARKTPQQLRAALMQITQGQNAIHQAAQKLSKATGKSSTRSFFNAVLHAGQAAYQLERFNALRAHEEMEKTEKVLQQLVMLMPAPKNGSEVKPIIPNNEPKDSDHPEAAAQAKELTELAAKQRALRKKLQDALSNPEWAKTPGKDNPLSELVKQQKATEMKTAELMQSLKQLAKAPSDSKDATKSAQRAAKSSEDAQKAMQKSQADSKQGKVGAAQKSANDAAKMLAQAAKQAEQTAMKLGFVKPNNKIDPKQMKSDQQIAQSLQKGQQQANMAKSQLNKGQLSPASQAMKQAAKALQQAQQKMSQQMQARMPATNTNVSFSKPALTPPDLGKYGREGEKNQGKAWGELPGKLKSRILADMRAQYGEEYAAIIQRYFERLAETD